MSHFISFSEHDVYIQFKVNNNIQKINYIPELLTIECLSYDYVPFGYLDNMSASPIFDGIYISAVVEYIY